MKKRNVAALAVITAAALAGCELYRGDFFSSMLEDNKPVIAPTCGYPIDDPFVLVSGAEYVGKGTTAQYSAALLGLPPEGAVSWSVSGAGHEGTVIDAATGALSVAADETNSPLVVRAVYAADTSVYDIFSVNVIDSVSVGGDDYATPGLPAQLSADVKDAGGDSLAGAPVTWSLVEEDANGTGTALNAVTGVLTVGENETSASFTVSASIAGKTSAPFTVYVDGGAANIEDFGSAAPAFAGPHVCVKTAADWNNLKDSLSAGGNRIVHIPAAVTNVANKGYDDNFSGGTVSIRGPGSIRIGDLYNGALLYFTEGRTVILRGPTLFGRGSGGRSGSNTGHLVHCSGGTFIMRDGEIRGNGAGGVKVYYYNSSNPGTFKMTGGSITGNKALEGGGVWLSHGSTFAKSGGTISGNTATSGDTFGHQVYLKKYDADEAEAYRDTAADPDVRLYLYPGSGSYGTYVYTKVDPDGGFDTGPNWDQ